MMSAFRNLAFEVFEAGIRRSTSRLRTVRPNYGIRNLAAGGFGPFRPSGRAEAGRFLASELISQSSLTVQTGASWGWERMEFRAW